MGTVVFIAMHFHLGHALSSYNAQSYAGAVFHIVLGVSLLAILVYADNKEGEAKKGNRTVKLS